MNDLFSVAPLVVIECLALAALLGAVLASFVGCAVARSLAGQSFLTGRSRCDSCGHVLGPFELVPIFSWLRQKGRCRWCGAKIPARCPITEGLTAAAFGAFVWRYGVSLQTLEYLIFTLILLAVALVDWDTGFIPDGLLLAGTRALVRPVHTRWMAAAIPNSRLDLRPGGTHGAFFQQKEDYLARILDFFRENNIK